MRTTPKLQRWLRRFTQARPAPKTPLPDNPYRRFFTPQRSFEQLVQNPAKPQHKPNRNL